MCIPYIPGKCLFLFAVSVRNTQVRKYTAATEFFGWYIGAMYLGGSKKGARSTHPVSERAMRHPPGITPPVSPPPRARVRLRLNGLRTFDRRW